MTDITKPAAFEPDISKLAERLEAVSFDQDELRELGERILAMYGLEVLNDVLEHVAISTSFAAGQADAVAEAIGVHRVTPAARSGLS
jgi:hypothetical protein